MCKNAQSAPNTTREVRGDIGAIFAFGSDNLLYVEELDPGGSAEVSGKVC